MLTYAAIVFAIAALGGIVLALHVLRGQLAPWALSLVHAALGATGIVLTLLALARGEGGNRGLTAVALLVVAALGGFYLASFHYRKAYPAKPIVIVHALVALAGFGALLAALGLI